VAFAQTGIGPITSSVPNARKRIAHPPNLIAPQFRLEEITNGFALLENPSGVITNFGFLNDFPPQTVEATKTEPDQNLFLVFNNGLSGPASGYNYGTRFIFQGHENAHDLAYVTRVNLDVSDPAHRITLLTPEGADGLTHFNSIDGSTYDPFTETLLFTQENGSSGGVMQITTGWPPVITTLDGVFGKAGYEGIHPDDQGNILIVEDSGGTSVNVDPNDPGSSKVARQPNSFVYRLIPTDITDLSKGGKLQALQVSIDGQPILFHADDPSGDVFADAQLQLHTLGTSYPVQWVTVHDTAVDGFDSFNANAAAKSAGATPFKRPENAAFLPGSGFRTFFFCPTGDTNADSGNVPELAARGVWGSIFRVDLSEDRDSGQISIFFLGDAIHSSFDNLTFADTNTLLATEDRGDGLHTQLDRLDSIWAFLVSDGSASRLVALGRDKLSEIDVNLTGTPGFQNEGDNEPTGLHVSAGGTTAATLPGTLADLNHPHAFFTQQHGENTLWQIVKKNDNAGKKK
jgi:hypothetical protein